MSAAEVIDLEEFLSGPEPDYDQEPVAPLGADDADRHLRHLRRLRRQLDAATETANEQRARIDLWLSVQKATIDKAIDYHEACLTAYHRAVIARDPKAKTIRLPNGVLASRSQQPEVTYTDEAAFLAWAQAHAPHLVRQPEPPAPAPDKVAARKALALRTFADDTTAVVFSETGETVPGVSIVERDRTYTAEVAQ